ncbi:hypothetical protein HMPREF0298_0087 [Corynebacterium lipophiloflavum DSM 44291]|uniref:Uncharacterized protein n=1 Tax=Corynebacterium lipophiloflavum (strain ATCC 700352 / DSM 44291 / CCUG 37336 / JCM 10383 / DMMZ 1944) TaxID=525263 RepID=C0XNR7_CORLD|nr:hypothetical protein HMPREF0298_0087 [Corynebacterium lipophiloflavum DSM 44291]
MGVRFGGSDGRMLSENPELDSPGRLFWATAGAADAPTTSAVGIAAAMSQLRL